MLGGKRTLAHGAFLMALTVIIYSPSTAEALCGRHSVCLLLCLALFALSLAPIAPLQTAGAQYVSAQVMCEIDEFISLLLKR